MRENSHTLFYCVEALSENHTNGDEDTKKEKVERREFKYITERVTGLILGVFLKGDKAGERGDKCAYTADINAEKQLAVIFSKLREEYCRGDIADDLTGKGAEKKRILFKEG